MPGKELEKLYTRGAKTVKGKLKGAKRRIGRIFSKLENPKSKKKKKKRVDIYSRGQVRKKAMEEVGKY